MALRHIFKGAIQCGKTRQRAATCLSVRPYSSRPEPTESGNLMDIGTRQPFTEEHDIFRQNARRFYREQVLPNNDEWEENGQVSYDIWEKAGKAGFLCCAASDKYGGPGGTLLHDIIMVEEQTYINHSGCGFGNHSVVVLPYIQNYGTEEQKQKFIPKMSDGSCIGAIVMTEPGAGSDLQSVRTNAKRDGDDWILNGSKVFITNGQMMGVGVVVALTKPDAKSPAHGISLFLVEEGMKGFKKGKKLKKMGLKAQDTSELFFEDVRLPKDALLGEENKGFYYLMTQLPQERLAAAIGGISHAEWMFEETRKYVKERKAFKRTVADLQTVQHKLAEMKTEICVGRTFVDNCIRIHMERGLDPQTASMAKYWCTDLQNRVAYQAVQLHGGWGYMWEYPIARAFVDARVQPIYAGTNEIMKELIGRKITRE